MDETILDETTVDKTLVDDTVEELVNEAGVQVDAVVVAQAEAATAAETAIQAVDGEVAPHDGAAGITSAAPVTPAGSEPAGTTPRKAQPTLRAGTQAGLRPGMPG